MFCFNDTATTEIYTLSLHDALPILLIPGATRPRGWLALVFSPIYEMNMPDAFQTVPGRASASQAVWLAALALTDRKSTRLNSSHANISYAVFCLKKKTHYLGG